MSKKRVLVVGGTGFLGQQLLQAIPNLQTYHSFYDVAFTYHSTPPSILLNAFPHFSPFLLICKMVMGLIPFPPLLVRSVFCFGFYYDYIMASKKKFCNRNVECLCSNLFDMILVCQPDVVVAVSVPRACEMNPAAAMSINVPTSLVNWLLSFKEKDTLLIHLSTDQVYEGTKSFYEEDDETSPVNVYGISKVQAERFIVSNCSNFAILRCSIIYGPQTISHVPKSLQIQWIDGILSKGSKADFLYDEFRCPVYVKDVMAVILALSTKWITDG